MTIFLLIFSVIGVSMLGLFLGLVFRGRKDKPKTCHGLESGESSHEDHACEHCSCGASERMNPRG